MKYKYTMQSEDEKIEMELDHVCLPEIVSFFERFLKACGYGMEGRTLEIVEED